MNRMINLTIDLLPITLLTYRLLNQSVITDQNVPSKINTVKSYLENYRRVSFNYLQFLLSVTFITFTTDTSDLTFENT